MTKDDRIALGLLAACVAFVLYRQHGATTTAATVKAGAPVALDPMAWLGAIGAP